MSSFVLLAISSGHVIVGKEVLVNVDGKEFDNAKERFRVKNPGTFVTFLMEGELESLLKEVQNKKAGRAF